MLFVIASLKYQGVNDLPEDARESGLSESIQSKACRT